MRAANLDLKIMHQIADYPELLNKSQIIPNSTSRFEFYLKDRKDNLKLITDNALLFEDFVLENDQYSSLALDFDNMKFLTIEGERYYQTLSLKHAVNLFVAYAESLNETELFSEKPGLNVSDYYNLRSQKNRQLTTLER